MSNELRRMIHKASRWADRQFARVGVITPMWHAVTATGEPIILGAILDDKDLQALLVRTTFRVRDVVRYVFMDEAWVVQGTQKDKEALFREAMAGRLNVHPNRREILWLGGEDQNGGQLNFHRAIIRPERGKPYLGELEEENFQESMGRYVGMLPQRGRPS